MEALLKSWEGETVVQRFDRPAGAWIFIAIHSTHLGPGVGGTRMKSYPDVQAALQDAMRLAGGMTYKFATPGMPYGGAKAVIAVPPDLDPAARPDLLRRYGALVHQLGGYFSTGPDMGTSPADMDIIAETGAPFIFARTLEAGGSGDPGPYTARGVLAGIQIASEHLFDSSSLQGRRVLVQGAGDVGSHLIGFLQEEGAEVLFSEVDQPAIRAYRDQAGLEFVPPAEVFDVECDIFAPCALGGILNPDTIPRLRCKAVAGGANNQLQSQEDSEFLAARDILYAPDYVINVGGAMAVMGRELQGWAPEQAEREVVDSVRATLRRIFKIASAESLTTEAAARHIAEERLSA